MNHLQVQSAFKFVVISSFGDGGQLMTRGQLMPRSSIYW